MLSFTTTQAFLWLNVSFLVHSENLPLSYLLSHVFELDRLSSLFLELNHRISVAKVTAATLLFFKRCHANTYCINSCSQSMLFLQRSLKQALTRSCCAGDACDFMQLSDRGYNVNQFKL
jgi:hypothetical protein